MVIFVHAAGGLNDHSRRVNCQRKSLVLASHSRPVRSSFFPRSAGSQDARAYISWLNGRARQSSSRAASSPTTFPVSKGQAISCFAAKIPCYHLINSLPVPIPIGSHFGPVFIRQQALWVYSAIENTLYFSLLMGICRERRVSS